MVDDVEGIPLLDVANAELSRFNMAVKRVFDLIVGGLMCVVILPFMAVVAVVIKLDSPGPVFYRQERMGRGGKPFWIFKFRSMHVGADEERLELAERQNDYDGPMFKLKEDPRITRVGGALRRWSIDELPQILNVMTGDMSLVGPRPLWVEEAKQCRGWTQKRLDITPGITGLWQVLGRSAIPFDEMVKLDYMYVTGWSLGWDIKLLLQTVPGGAQQARGVLTLDHRRRAACGLARPAPFEDVGCARRNHQQARSRRPAPWRKDSQDDTQDPGRRGPHPHRRSCPGCRPGSGDLPSPDARRSPRSRARPPRSARG